jgi:hypothetical protein
VVQHAVNPELGRCKVKVVALSHGNTWCKPSGAPSRSTCEGILGTTGGLLYRWSMSKGRGGDACRNMMKAGEGMCRLGRNKGGVRGVISLGMMTQRLLGTTRHLGMMNFPYFK